MTITPGTRWRNIHTDREDTVRKVGPYRALDGAARIWLVDPMDVTPVEGWDRSGRLPRQLEACPWLTSLSTEAGANERATGAP